MRSAFSVFLVVLSLGTPFATLRAIGTGSSSEEPLVPRRVLILDFVNQQKNANADYLSVTIAEALIDPLKKTGKFEILARGGSTALTNPANAGATDSAGAERSRSTPHATFNEAEAIQIGIAADADVVVIGNFVAVQNVVQIQAKAIDVGQKRLALSKARRARLDATIFDSINALAVDMTREMAEKLPPLAQREVIREAAGDFIARAPVFHAYGNAGFVWGNERQYVAQGFAGGLDVSFQFLHRYIQPYFSADALFASGVDRVTTMTLFGADGGLAARMNFFNGRFNLTPVITGGFQTGTINAAYAIKYLVPTIAGGLIADFFLFDKISLALAVKQYVLIESDTPLKILSLQIGVGVRL